MHAALLALATGDRWSTPELLTRFGLPLLLIAVALALYLWGRRERAEARSRIGAKGGVGAPGTLDIGTELGFAVEGRGPDPRAGRGKILFGLFGTLVGALLLLGMIVWRILG